MSRSIADYLLADQVAAAETVDAAAEQILSCLPREAWIGEASVIAETLWPHRRRADFRGPAAMLFSKLRAGFADAWTRQAKLATQPPSGLFD